MTESQPSLARPANKSIQLQDATAFVALKNRTLTQLYNDRPTWLANANRKLDETVFATYDWPSNLTDDDMLAKLLVLNLERSQANP